VLGSEHLVHFRVDAPRVRDEDELRGQLGPVRDPAAAGGPPPGLAVQSEGEIVAAAAASGVARVDPRSARTHRRC
jgi:hypothetical protein